MNPTDPTIVTAGLRLPERPTIAAEALSGDRETRLESAVEDRAIVFIDGSNWYHGLRRHGVRSSLLDYRKVAGKLARGRPVRSVRYYIGKAVRGTRSEMGQHRFLAALREQGVEVVLGKMQRNSLSSGERETRERLLGLLRSRADEVPGEVSEAIRIFLEPAWDEVEKQVDTAISADLVDLAHRGEYEVAYLLSADSDFIPAVRVVRRLGKTVFGASADPSYELGRAVTKYLWLRPDWFEGLYS